MDRASVDVALTGTRTMSAEDLSAGFLNLQRLQARDETFQPNVAGAVQYNADLLNLLVTRVNALEAATVLSNDGLQKASDFTTDGLQRRPTTVMISTRSCGRTSTRPLPS